jgi:hypothetical protein
MGFEDVIELFEKSPWNATPLSIITPGLMMTLFTTIE